MVHFPHFCVERVFLSNWFFSLFTIFDVMAGRSSFESKFCLCVHLLFWGNNFRGVRSDNEITLL